MFIALNEGISSYQWTIIILICILIVASIYIYKKYDYVPKWLSYGVAALIAMLAGSSEKKGTTGDATLDEVIKTGGYSYDPKQDIFYSNMDAWQRGMGYCRLYDEAAAPLGMIIDCEPIYFNYGGKSWMIEFWKGQYDLTAGGEIGVYNTERPELNIPDIFKGNFYCCASDTELLQMSFTLKRNGKTLLKRKDKHWWLTAFKVGEFAEPTELTMYLTITLKDEEMLNAFVKGLEKAGYLENEIIIKGYTVGLEFNKPRTVQPVTRRKETDRIIQLKNKLLCEKYEEITEGYDNFPDKMKALQEKAPEIYKQIMNMGKTKELFSKYEKIKKYLD